jgi:hypothetical protein
MTINMPVDDKALAADSQTTTPTLYQRVLIAVADAGQVGPVVELARRAGVGEARVLHLNLRESYRGRRFPLETDAAASYAAEAAVFELRMAGIAASGPARRSDFVTRLFGSVAQRVIKHAPCPVLVAAPAGMPSSHSVAAAEHAAAAR